ncbi:MAG: YkvA family protein [Gammaproteobacteria bacterium]
MTLRVTFVLDERDIKQLSREMKNARRRVQSADDEEIIQAAREILSDVAKTGQVSDFVRTRLSRLELMIEMIEDEDWRLPKKDRTPVLNVLVYFGDPEDLIPDHVPGLGLLDDAIMIELALRQLRHQIEAYEDFKDFREGLDAKNGIRDSARDDRLTRRRAALHERITRRQRREKRPSLLSNLFR